MTESVGHGRAELADPVCTRPPEVHRRRCLAGVQLLSATVSVDAVDCPFRGVAREHIGPDSGRTWISQTPGSRSRERPTSPPGVSRQRSQVAQQAGEARGAGASFPA